jgi:hypothetical protein
MRSNYRSVPFEITRAGNAYYLNAGARRVMCDHIFRSEDDAGEVLPLRPGHSR